MQTSSGGVLRVPIPAQVQARSRNADDGTSLIPVTPVNGLPSSGVADTLTGGFDTEELERGEPASLSGITGRRRAGLTGTMSSGLKKCPALPAHGHTVTGWERGLSV